MRILFAMELSLELHPGSDRVLEGLTGFARAMPQGGSRSEKADFYRGLARYLSDRAALFRRGIWDYSDDATEARTMFADYGSVLQTKKGARSIPSQTSGQGPMRSAGGPFFANVTFAWLVQGGSAGAEVLARACEGAQDALWHRRTFLRLLQAVPMVAPSCIESDVFYVIPSESAYALTSADLADPVFNYLRVIDG